MRGTPEVVSRMFRTETEHAPLSTRSRRQRYGRVSHVSITHGHNRIQRLPTDPKVSTEAIPVNPRDRRNERLDHVHSEKIFQLEPN